MLRFEDNALAERWSQLDWPVRFDAHGITDYATGIASPLQPRLERITLEPGARMELAYGTGFLVVTETGTLEIRGRKRSSTPVAAVGDEAAAVQPVGSEPVALREGELGLTGRNGPYTIRALGDTPTTFRTFV